MSDYTYRTIDLTTGTVLNDFPLDTNSLPRTISSDADTTFTLPLYDKSVRDLDPKTCTEPGRTGLFALQDGNPVWGGIIWARSYARSTRSLTLTCSTVESYHRHRVFNQRIEITRDQAFILLWVMTGIWPLGTDQMHWELGPDYDSFSEVFSIDSRSIKDYDGREIIIADGIFSIRYPYWWGNDDTNLWYTNLPPSGIPATRIFEIGKNAYDAMVELTTIRSGIEWTYDPTRFDDGALGWLPRIGVPRIGRTVDETAWSWIASMPRVVNPLDTEQDTPGDNIEDYTYNEDARPSANHVVGTGAEIDGVVLKSDRGNLKSIRAGYPALEIAESYQDIPYQVTLNSQVEGDLEDHPLPVKSSVWVVNSKSEPAFGSYALGDEASFGVSDDMDPPQKDNSPGRISVERIIAWSLRPSSDSAREIVSLTTNPIVQASPRMPPSLKRRYDNFQRGIRGLSITSRSQKSNISVFSTNTRITNVPQSTSSYQGAYILLSSFNFIKQSEALRIAYQGLPDLGGIVTEYYAMNYPGSLQGVPTPNKDGGYSNYTDLLFDGSTYRDMIPLDNWKYGDTVAINVYAYQVALPTPYTVAMQIVIAYQGPK